MFSLRRYEFSDFDLALLVIQGVGEINLLMRKKSRSLISFHRNERRLSGINCRMNHRRLFRNFVKAVDVCRRILSRFSKNHQVPNTIDDFTKFQKIHEK